MNELRIGMLGFGTVGLGTAKLLLNQQELLEERTGVRMRLVAIATKDPERDRGIDLGDVELGTDVNRIIQGNDIDVVVELIGGIHPAYEYVRQSLENGKDVVTANKALLASHGNELFRLAEKLDRDLGYEASVAGAIPVIKTLKESLAANRIQQVFGILNGTCNHILTEMRERNLSYEESLRNAQELGFAEADPTFDVEGIDAAHKLAILSAIAFGTPISVQNISVEGITRITDIDITWATEMGYRIKLLAVAKLENGMMDLRVQPTIVPLTSMVAAVEGVFNAVFVQGDFSGTTMYYGRGAGEKPTASSVVSDLVEIARNLKSGSPCRVPSLSFLTSHLREYPTRPLGDLSCEYYLRLMVEDKPGVLADITAILKNQQVSIKILHQQGRSKKDAVPLVMVTHECSERRMQASLQEIRQLPSVKEEPNLIRIAQLPV
ncbi:MAG: homoserine dehydrogenase [Magnetococcales bacterium]|nr:homoserine dehydrogenase [Magnetococcales bacterium]NGZ26114.1 homoserine dehydrogenase [Magnetococcales bacterium]